MICAINIYIFTLLHYYIIVIHAIMINCWTHMTSIQRQTRNLQMTDFHVYVVRIFEIPKLIILWYSIKFYILTYSYFSFIFTIIDLSLFNPMRETSTSSKGVWHRQMKIDQYFLTIVKRSVDTLFDKTQWNKRFDDKNNLISQI